MSRVELTARKRSAEKEQWRLVVADEEGREVLATLGIQKGARYYVQGRLMDLQSGYSSAVVLRCRQPTRFFVENQTKDAFEFEAGDKFRFTIKEVVPRMPLDVKSAMKSTVDASLAPGLVEVLSGVRRIVGPLREQGLLQTDAVDVETAALVSACTGGGRRRPQKQTAEGAMSVVCEVSSATGKAPFSRLAMIIPASSAQWERSPNAYVQLRNLLDWNEEAATEWADFPGFVEKDDDGKYRLVVDRGENDSEQVVGFHVALASQIRPGTILDARPQQVGGKAFQLRVVTSKSLTPSELLFHKDYWRWVAEPRG